MIREIEIEEALNLEEAVYIDVRSPAEFEEDTIPGAINLPLLDNQERKIIGIMYKSEGPTIAKNKALEIVAPKLPKLVKEIRKYIKKKIVVFCWRGGNRSQNLCSILKMVDIPTFRIKGGYKAYRKYVYNYLYSQNTTLIKNIFVLDGLTGVGKTQIINFLPKYGIKTIDLEKLANNRGSVFGNLGFENQPTQKTFDSSIFYALFKLKNDTPIVVEGESKRIGRLFIPDLLWKSMNNAKRILVYDNMEKRILRSINEYVTNQNISDEEYIVAIRKLKSRLGKNTVEFLENSIYEHNYKDVTAILLKDYYDKIYKIPDDSRYCLRISSADLDIACQEIKKFIHSSLES